MLRHRKTARLLSPDPVHGERRELGHVDFDHLEFVERMVGERIGLVAGALDVGIGERLAVHDYARALGGTSSRLACSAAGFIATSTLGSSPAVKISLLEKFS